MKKVFPFLGVRFISINDRIDTLSKPADISAQIKNMANEMYAKGYFPKNMQYYENPAGTRENL